MTTTAKGSTTSAVVPGRSTTGIGSLPHHNIDAALAFSLKLDIPFLPQIPIRNPWEFMIAQALEGLPGLAVEKDGSVFLDLNVWSGRARALNTRLEQAFAAIESATAFEAFEPSSATSSSWQPFLWELEERKFKLAKIQLAGPLTSQWVLRLKDGSPAARDPDITTQIFRLVLARALAMSKRLLASGITPLLYLDEPGLFAFSASDPKHMLALQELRLVVKTLRNAGVVVGLHCCSNTDWKAVLSLPLHFLSIDAGLSLSELLKQREAVEQFLDGGGRLSLGVIPTSMRASEGGLERYDAKQAVAELRSVVESAFSGQHGFTDRPELARKLLSEALYTPACGLALHSATDAELVLSALLEFGREIKSLR